MLLLLLGLHLACAAGHICIARGHRHVSSHEQPPSAVLAGRERRRAASAAIRRYGHHGGQRAQQRQEKGPAQGHCQAAQRGAAAPFEAEHDRPAAPVRDHPQREPPVPDKGVAEDGFGGGVPCCACGVISKLL